MVVGSELGMGAKSVGTRPTSSMLVSMIEYGLDNKRRAYGVYLYQCKSGRGIAVFLQRRRGGSSFVVRAKRTSAMQLGDEKKGRKDGNGR